MSFAKQSLLVLASLAASAYAANFKLVAEVTAFDLTPSVNGQALDSFVVHGCGRVARFSSAGAVWVTTDHSTLQIVESAGPTSELFVHPGGTATVPNGAAVSVGCGTGTAGVGIENGVLAFQNGSWMACPNSLLEVSGVDPSMILLSFKKAGQRTLAGCADVTLRAVAA